MTELPDLVRSAASRVVGSLPSPVRDRLRARGGQQVPRTCAGWSVFTPRYASAPYVSGPPG